MNTKNTRRLTVVVALFRLVLVLWALCGVIWFAAFFGSVTCSGPECIDPSWVKRWPILAHVAFMSGLLYAFVITALNELPSVMRDLCEWRPPWARDREP